MFEVILLAEVEDWYLAICADEPELADRIRDAIDRLAEVGPTLGRPLVDTLTGTKVHNLKELRPTSNSASAVRVLFVFDEQRQAVLLVAGDKATEGQWSAWYRTAIPLAEHRYGEWIARRREDRP